MNGQRKPCGVCQSLAERFPSRTVKAGRPRSDGQWRCEDHGTHAPTPDPTRTLVGLQQSGYVRDLQAAARQALGVLVDPVVLREALEGVIRSAELENV